MTSKTMLTPSPRVAATLHLRANVIASLKIKAFVHRLQGQAASTDELPNLVSMIQRA